MSVHVSGHVQRPRGGPSNREDADTAELRGEEVSKVRPGREARAM